MAATNKSCAACLQLQERVEVECVADANTRECFAGLYESAVPVRVGENVLGYLQTGQILLRAPTRRRFGRIALLLDQWGPHARVEELETAYFQTRVVIQSKYESTVRLLVIFAKHLASIAHQMEITAQFAEALAIARARTYIAEKQSEDLSLREVARVAGMNAFYFCKLFRRTTGLTFTHYLARARIESVKRLLLDPHMRMSEAAYASGFQSLSQFNRLFHRLVGESPSSFHHRLHPMPRGPRSPLAA
jgi:AraC-like DNA-binding protein